MLGEVLGKVPYWSGHAGKTGDGGYIATPLRVCL